MFVQLPEEGWETIIWLKSWSEETEDVFLHRVKITRTETSEGKAQFYASFQLFRHDRNKVITFMPLL